MMRISLILFLSLFVIFSLAEEAKQSEDVSVLNRIARSSGRDVKKDNKAKKRNTNSRKRNKAKKVKKEKRKNKDRKKRNKAKKVKNEKKTKKDRKKKNKAKNSRKSKSKSKKSKNRKNRPRNKKSKKEKKRSRKQKKKNQENGRRKGSKKCARQSGPDDSTCMVNIGTAMDYEGNQVANFLKQKKRIESFSKLMGKKGDKKGNFANSTSLITSACSSGSSDSSTTDTIATLNNCSASVEDGCTVPTVDTASLDSCVTSFTAVETKNAECYALLTAASPVLSDACTCYAAAAALVEETKLLSCSAKDEFDKVRTAKSSCLDSFSSCKKAEDASIGLIHICGGGTTPAPITTVTSAATTAGATTAGATTAAGATTTAAPTTAGATTTAGSGTTSSGGSKGYTKAWLRGEGPAAHVHEGIRLQDKSGWVGIGETLAEDLSARSQVQVRRVDNEAATQWTTSIGEAGAGKFSVGYSVIEGPSALYVGIGLWQTDKQIPAVVALDPSTGAVIWTRVLTSTSHGGVRSCVMDNTDIVCAGYRDYGTTGFVFVADEGKPVVWRLSSDGTVTTEQTLSISGMGQVAKIRRDATSGFVLCSTAYASLGGADRNVMALVKLDNSLSVEWSQTYGLAGGETQVFDMLVDTEGNYLLGGHTTVGTGVVNWDYVALKVNSQTRAEIWRRTYGQPRGFDAQWIHDEMYGVALDKEGNYLLLGGSGDEYTYSANGSGEWQGWSSDTWGSYLVVVTKEGETLYQNFWGDKGGNNAGEWLSVDTDSGEVMIYTDSDTAPGFGFLKLTPVQ